MNVELLRMLRSMAEVEKKPEFLQKKYIIVDKKDRQVDPSSGAVPVVLKHPKHVIVVASPTGKAPPPAVGERRVSLLSTAIKMASVMSSNGKKGCSIVVHEGLYINPTAYLSDSGIVGLKWKDGFSLEIIGIEEVRILNIAPLLHPFHFLMEDMELTMKNITIYERRGGSVTEERDEGWTRCKLGGSTFRGERAVISLRDVRVHAPDECPLHCARSSVLRATDCDFFDFMCSFRVDQGSTAELTNCRFFFEHARDVHKDISYGNLVGKSRAILRRCQFIGEPAQQAKVYSGNFTRRSRRAAVFVISGGSLEMFECLVTGFLAAVQIKDSHSRAVLDRCQLLNCTLAIHSFINSSVSVTNCELATNYVLKLELNVTGKVQFRGNSVKTFPIPANPPPFPFPFPFLFPFPIGTKDKVGAADKDGTAVIKADREPKVVEHDFDHFRVEYYEPEEWKDDSFDANPKKRLEKEYFENTGEPHRPRQCLHCWVLIYPPEGKLMYCSRCRKVGYCSKECQQANWKDHKMVCKKT